mgnify:CR=1 FL=1
MRITQSQLRRIIKEELEEVLDEKIKKVDGGYYVTSKSGRHLSKKPHKTRKAALAQLGAVEASKAEAMNEEELDERCQKGYKTHETRKTKKMFGKTFKDPSNTNEKFLRTNIRNLKKILEEKGLDPKRIAHSIRNISSTKDTINFYVIRSMKKLVKFRRTETILNLIDFKKEPEEIKFRIINNIVKKRANSYYPPRSYKVVNLINRFENNKVKKCTLGGCFFEKRKNSLHVSREF